MGKKRNFVPVLVGKPERTKRKINKETMEDKKAEGTQKAERTYRCNDCGGTIYRHEVFCSKCGKLLDRYDFED